MKNETIEILAEGDNFLPKGAKITTHIIKPSLELGETSWVTTGEGQKVHVNEDSNHAYSVDFSEVPPLYPTKDMTVPSDGIEFADGDGKLLDVGKCGITYLVSPGNTYLCYWKDVNLEFELKRTLPKTITVCADCFKEMCECKHEEGWYRVLSMDNKWYLRYYVNGAIYSELMRDTQYAAKMDRIRMGS